MEVEMNTSSERSLSPNSNDGKFSVATIRDWFLKNLKLAALVLGVAGTVCWLLNVALMVFYYDGWAKVPPLGLATGAGNVIYAGIFWAVVSSVIVSLLIHNGTNDRKTRDAKPLYQTEIKNDSPKKNIFLTGVALGVVLFQFLGAIVPLYAIILFVARMSVVAFWITLMSFRAWMATMGVLANRFPAKFSAIHNKAIEGRLNPLLWLRRASSGLLVGTTINFLVYYLFSSNYMGEISIIPKLILALVIGFCIWQVMRGSGKRGGSINRSAFLILMASATLMDALLTGSVFADDGGWQESGGTFAGLLDNPGFFSSLLMGVPGGLSGGIGALSGFMVEKIFDRHTDIEAAMREEMERARARAKSEKVIAKELGVMNNVNISPDVDVPNHLRPRLSELADRYYEATGKKLTVTDGVRTAQDQAQRVLERIEDKGMEDTLTFYRDSEGIKRVVEAYGSQETAEGRLEAMAKVIKERAEQGKYLSNHLPGNSLDIRSNDMTSDETKVFKRLFDGREGIELSDHTLRGVHPHYHLDFKQPPQQPVTDPERYSVHESGPTTKAPDLKGNNSS
jgi:hypothetical protein